MGRNAVVACFLVVALAGCAGHFGRTPDARQEFQFQMLGVETPRQEGRVLNLFLRYRYPSHLAASEYPDYRVIRDEVLEFIRVRPAEPGDEFWEVLNGHLARHVFEKFPLKGLSIQIQVQPTANAKLDEPGFHSSIVTLGRVTPVSGHGRYLGAPPPPR